MVYWLPEWQPRLNRPQGTMAQTTSPHAWPALVLSPRTKGCEHQRLVQGLHANPKRRVWGQWAMAGILCSLRLS